MAVAHVCGIILAHNKTEEIQTAFGRYEWMCLIFFGRKLVGGWWEWRFATKAKKRDTYALAPAPTPCSLESYFVSFYIYFYVTCVSLANLNFVIIGFSTKGIVARYEILAKVIVS